MRKTTVVLIFAALTFATSQRAAAGPMLLTLTGTSDTSLTASVVLTYDNTLGQLTLDISNTSLSDDPRITSFAFNTATQITGIDSFSSSLTGWGHSFDRDAINTPGQFGLFDVAGVTGSGFNGGFPHSGIVRGSTAQFQFIFTGSNLTSLTESTFLNLLSFDAAGPPSEAEQTFIARFQRTGSDGEGSDVAIPNAPPVPVPEPAALFLTSLGLICVAARRRRRS